MQGPITWRNVDAPALGDAINAGVTAQRSLNAGFDNFNQLLQQRQATVDANWKNQQETLKQNFLDALYGAKTPEQLAALQQSGQLSSMVQGMTPEMRATVRGQDEQRLANLRTLTQQEQAYKDAQQQREWKPTVDRLTVLSHSDDEDLRTKAREALGLYGAAGLPAGKLAADFSDTERAIQQFDSRLATEQSQRASASASQAAMAEQLKLTKMQVKQQQEQELTRTLLGQIAVAAAADKDAKGETRAGAIDSATAAVLKAANAPDTVKAQVLASAAEKKAAAIALLQKHADETSMIGTKPLTGDQLVELPKHLAAIPGSDGDKQSLVEELTKAAQKPFMIKGQPYYPTMNMLRMAAQESTGKYFGNSSRPFYGIFGNYRGDSAADYVSKMKNNEEFMKELQIKTGLDEATLRSEFDKATLSSFAMGYGATHGNVGTPRSHR